MNGIDNSWRPKEIERVKVENGIPVSSIVPMSSLAGRALGVVIINWFGGGEEGREEGEFQFPRASRRAGRVSERGNVATVTL